MPEPGAFQEFPATLKQSTQHPEVVYRRADDLVAVRGPGVQAASDAVLTVTADDGETIAVYRREPSARRADSATATPAYVREPAQIGVPTGRVFLRFREGVTASGASEALARAGYHIVNAPAWAPHTAWLEALDGTSAFALQNIDRLEALPDVENVEPQFLAPRVAR